LYKTRMKKVFQRAALFLRNEGTICQPTIAAQLLAEAGHILYLWILYPIHI
jgi:hypothetical protein